MRLKSSLLLTLLLIGMVFTVVPAMGKVNPPPQSAVVPLTQELRRIVNSADPDLFKGFGITITDQVKAALLGKIDDVIRMFEKGNFQGGYNKLDNDIAPKLGYCETKRVRALSWLSDDPKLLDRVHQLRDTCQDLIEQIRLADPRPTP